MSVREAVCVSVCVCVCARARVLVLVLVLGVLVHGRVLAAVSNVQEVAHSGKENGYLDPFSGDKRISMTYSQSWS